MDKNKEIVLKKKLDVTELNGEKVMIDFETGKYFLIKGAGNDIWEYIQETTTPAKITEQLLKEYDVSEEECEASVMAFLDNLDKYGFIE